MEDLRNTPSPTGVTDCRSLILKSLEEQGFVLSKFAKEGREVFCLVPKKDQQRVKDFIEKTHPSIG